MAWSSPFSWRSWRPKLCTDERIIIASERQKIHSPRRQPWVRRLDVFQAMRLANSPHWCTVSLLRVARLTFRGHQDASVNEAADWETGIPSFPRKRESSLGSGRPHRPFKSVLGSRFRGNDAGERNCGASLSGEGFARCPEASSHLQKCPIFKPGKPG